MNKELRLNSTVAQYRILSRLGSGGMGVTRLTSTGRASRAAISPDGKTVVYVLDDGGRQSLSLVQVANSGHVEVVAPADARYAGITFSRDGISIYYVRTDADHPNGALYQAPVLGGSARQLLVDIASPITLSPDGRQFAFVREDPRQKETDLVVVNATAAGTWPALQRSSHIVIEL